MSDKNKFINKRLIKLKSKLGENKQIKITYFVKDEKKAGGKYLTVTRLVEKN